MFEVATWLRNFSILNGLASEKIFSKCEERFKEFCDSDLGNTQDTKKFLQEYSKFYFIKLVDLIENLRADIVKTFAEFYYQGKEETALKKIRAANPETIFTDKTIIVLILLIFIVFSSYILITYIPNGEVTENRNKIFNLHFPAFSFSLLIFLLLNGMALDMVILRYYRINYVYLLDLDPCINLELIHIFKVSEFYIKLLNIF